jgi:hypothetical protein
MLYLSRYNLNAHLPVSLCHANRNEVLFTLTDSGASAGTSVVA